MVLKWRKKYWCPHIVMMHQQVLLLEVECPRVLPGEEIVLQIGRRTIPSAFNASGRMVRELSSNAYVFPGITSALSIASVLLYPKTLGGCAVFSGFLPFGSSFVSRVAAEAKKTPVLWVHGRADFLVPIEAGKDGTKFLRGRLGMRCEFKVYDRLGHELAPYELQYCKQWADGGGGGSGEHVQGRSVDCGVPRSRGSCSCGFSFFTRS